MIGKLLEKNRKASVVIHADHKQMHFCILQQFHDSSQPKQLVAIYISFGCAILIQSSTFRRTFAEGGCII